jgi:manganese transport protein
VTMGEPVKLVFIGAIAQGLMLPFLAIAALYFRHRRTDRELQPGNGWTVCLWVSAIAMMVAGGYQILTKLGVM